MLYIILDTGGSARYVIIDTSSFADINPQNCTADSFCLKWVTGGQLSISNINHNCHLIEFKTTGKRSLIIKFDVSQVNLYGGAEGYYQSWPIQNVLNDVPYVSSEGNVQAVLEGYWLDSEGHYLYVEEATPLFVTFNKKILQLRAQRKEPYTDGKITSLKCRLCTFENVRAAHEDAIAHVLGKPNKVPDFKMVQYPIWSTWARYKVDISEKVVLKFAEEITANGFPNSQLEIDDNWEECYGSLVENKTKFPDFKRMVNHLKSMGFRVTLWVHPFVNIDCEPYFNHGIKNGYFVKGKNGSVETSWWNGRTAQIDFTNPDAVNWWQQRLRNITANTGIDSFKFDAGESSWSPSGAVYHTMRNDYPETILKEYINSVAVFGEMVEVRAARKTQSQGLFLRMIDRNSSWEGDVGMNTLIPTLLLFNLLGYPFVLPDMIGGNGYGNQTVTDELFIRWLQINVFMPSLQFSYVPWDFSETVSKKELHLRLIIK